MMKVDAAVTADDESGGLDSCRRVTIAPTLWVLVQLLVALAACKWHATVVTITIMV
jgi:hypothetical protein